jgi:hypothetical protein
MTKLLTVISIATIATFSAPALADRPRGMSDAEWDDYRIAKCVREYGEEHANRCVEIIDGPRAVARKARRDYYRNWDAERLECRNDSATANKRTCRFR